MHGKSSLLRAHFGRLGEAVHSSKADINISSHSGSHEWIAVVPWSIKAPCQGREFHRAAASLRTCPSPAGRSCNHESSPAIRSLLPSSVADPGIVIVTRSRPNEWPVQIMVGQLSRPPTCPSADGPRSPWTLRI